MDKAIPFPTIGSETKKSHPQGWVGGRAPQTAHFLAQSPYPPTFNALCYLLAPRLSCLVTLPHKNPCTLSYPEGWGTPPPGLLTRCGDARGVFQLNGAKGLVLVIRVHFIDAGGLTRDTRVVGMRMGG